MTQIEINLDQLVKENSAVAMSHSQGSDKLLSINLSYTGDWSLSLVSLWDPGHNYLFMHYEAQY